MRYRALDAVGDYQYGRAGLFLIDTPAAVAQAILTRLKLWTGEWLLDTTAGTDYAAKILGTGTQDSRDVEVRARILDTPGVLGITKYASSASPQRVLRITATVQTVYGATTITTGF